MQPLGPAAFAALILILTLASATTGVAQPAVPLDDAAPDGFAGRANRLVAELRTRNCDAQPDGPARQACVDAALATVNPAGFAAQSGAGR